MYTQHRAALQARVSWVASAMPHHDDCDVCVSSPSSSVSTPGYWHWKRFESGALVMLKAGWIRRHLEKLPPFMKIAQELSQRPVPPAPPQCKKPFLLGLVCLRILLPPNFKMSHLLRRSSFQASAWRTANEN